MRNSIHRLPYRILFLVFLFLFWGSVGFSALAQANQPPTVADVAPQTVEAGQSINVDISYSDPDGNAVTVTEVVDNAAVATVTPSQSAPQTLSISGVSAGTATITVTVDDGLGGTASTSFGVTVNAPPTAPLPPPNNPPVIAAIAPQTLNVGQSVTVALTYSDPDANPLTVTAVVDNAAVASVTQVDAQTLSVSGLTAGTAAITVTVDDGLGGIASTSFGVTVNTPASLTNNPPVIAAIAPQTLNVGQSTVITLAYSDPDSDSLSVSAVSDNTSIATVAQTTATTLTVTGAAVGTANVSVTVDDGKGGKASVSFVVTVTDGVVPSPDPTNQPPVIAPLNPQVVAVGQSLTIPDGYSDPDGDAVIVTVTSDNPAVATGSQSAPLELSVLGVGVGTANLTITVSDNRGGVANASFAVTVSVPNQPPVISHVAVVIEIGQAVKLDVGYSDPESDSVTISALSDNPAVAILTQTAPQKLVVTGVSAGTALITVMADDGHGGLTNSTFAVTVNPPDQLPVIEPILSQTLKIGESIEVPFTYSDPDNDPLIVESMSDSTDVATVTQTTAQTLQISALSAGTAMITVTVDDGRGGKASTSFAVTVSFIFAAGGDIGANSAADASLRAIVPSGASFFLALGDLDYDQTPTDAAWCDYVKARVGADFPVEVLTGNHEEGSATAPGPDGYIGNHAACLPDHFAVQPVIPGTPGYPGNYYFDYPANHPIMRFILLSADLKYDGVAYTFNTKEQTNYNALAARIDEAKQAGLWVVVGEHKNCLTTGQKSCEIGADLINLLIEKKVDLVLQGHDHNYQRSKQLALGAACAKVVPGTYDPNCVIDDGSDNLYTSGAGTVFLINGVVGRCCYAVNPADTEAGYFVTIVGQTTVETSGFVTYTVSSTRIDARVVNSVGAWGDSFSIVKP